MMILESQDSAMKKTKMKTVLVAVYLFLLFFIALYSRQFGPAVNQAILWIGGPFVSALILFPVFTGKFSIPKPLLLYASLPLFGLLGAYKVMDEDGFLRYMQVLISNFVLMMVVYYSIEKWQDIMLIVKAVGLSCLVVVAISFYMDVPAMEDDEVYRLSGITGNANGLANYARMGVFCSFLLIENWKSKFVKLLLFGAIAFFSYSVILSASRGNFANLVFAVGGYFIVKYFSGPKIIILGILLFFFGNLIFIMFENYLQDFFLYQRIFRSESIAAAFEQEKRIDLYEIALNLIIEYPVFGVGLNQFRFYSGGFITHTDILDVMVQLGIIAGIVYIAMYYSILKGLIRSRKYFEEMLNNKSHAILILWFVSEILLGFVNPNWFSQLQIVVIGLFVGASSYNVYYNTAKQRNINIAE
jgi:O-antigen ligase